MSLELTRAIKKVWKSEPTREGAGVNLKRAFGFRDLPLLDPFLLLDDFRSENPADYKAGFPWHPHRGIETITYVLEGDVEHGDSLGNRGNISAGDVQWMTAGSGIIHQEMPLGNHKGQMLGFQLWVNLPARAKMIDPQYQEIKQQQIPVITLEGGVKIRIICGEVNGVKGPAQNVMVNPNYLDIEVPRGKTFTHTVNPEHTVLAYVIDGAGYFDAIRDPFAHKIAAEKYFDFNPPCMFGDGTLVLYERNGSQIVVNAEKQAVRFLLISGQPLNEPVAWYGPIVMNSSVELEQAFTEYKAGNFIKHK